MNDFNVLSPSLIADPFIPSFFSITADGSGTIMVRGCALDSGTLTTDTEIIRMSHCGSFYFDDK